jgi:hypothetical protein
MKSTPSILDHFQTKENQWIQNDPEIKQWLDWLSKGLLDSSSLSPAELSKLPNDFDQFGIDLDGSLVSRKDHEDFDMKGLDQALPVTFSRDLDRLQELQQNSQLDHQIKELKRKVELKKSILENLKRESKEKWNLVNSKVSE